MATKTNILLVDDEKEILSVLSKELTQKGYEVTSVQNAKLGFDKIKTKEFPVVITDIKMFEMSGTELLKKVKKLDNKIEVIIITGFPHIPITDANLRKLQRMVGTRISDRSQVVKKTKREYCKEVWVKKVKAESKRNDKLLPLLSDLSSSTVFVPPIIYKP